MADEQGTELVQKDGALTAVAVSAAVGAAVYGLRKAFAGNGEGPSLHRHDAEENARPRNGSLVVSAVESVSDSILPLAEAAAEEAGRWVARNSPAFVRDRLLPRFIDAFKAAA